MEIEDCSQWHHLIFCEELLNNDGENDDFCKRCNESVLGCPAYKCLECNYFQHESCPDSSYTEYYDHIWQRERHHLILVEELDNGGKEEDVCPGCNEPASGPAYKCSIPKCTFFLHKWCTGLSHVIQHPVHSKHLLFLQKPVYDILPIFQTSPSCDGCGNDCSRSFFYRCFLCDFYLDVKCASRLILINPDDCHQHTLALILTQIQFTCQACGKEEPNNIECLCTICGLLIHGKCARYPRTIKPITHDHSLTRTYSLRQVEIQENVFCKLCYRKMNTQHAAYYCQKCGYIAHLKCASMVRDSTVVASNSVGYESHFVHLVEGINLTEDEGAGPHEIEHFSHPQHNLILSNEELTEEKRCEVCMQFVISVPFYCCAQCNIFFHYRCTKLPTIIKRGQFHRHSLTLLSQDLYAKSGLFKCNACGRYRHGFCYQCDECKWYKLDIQCCLIPRIINHEGHNHSLRLIITAHGTCNGCGKEGVNFKCIDCNNFTLCYRCATLPFISRYKYDMHLLKLSSMHEDDFGEDDFGEYYCLICEEKRDSSDHLFYYCAKCKFTAHSQCVLGENHSINYGRTFTDKDHKHPLTIVQKTKHSPPCDACGKSFIDVAFECTQCKFNVHPMYCLKKLRNLG